MSCNGPEPEKDTQAPIIVVKQKEFNVIGGAAVSLGASELKL